MDIIFNIVGQKISRLDNNLVVGDSKNYLTALFAFSGEWDNLSKTAVFKNDDYTLNVLIQNNTCKVPHELLSSGSFNVSVFGGDLITTNTATVRVTPSGINEGGMPEDPPPSIYAQIYRIAEDAKEIAESVEERADSGEFKGEKGDPGEGSGIAENCVTLDKEQEIIGKKIIRAPFIITRGLPTYEKIEPTPTEDYMYYGNYYLKDGGYVLIGQELPSDVIVGETDCFYECGGADACLYLGDKVKGIPLEDGEEMYEFMALMESNMIQMLKVLDDYDPNDGYVPDPSGYGTGAYSFSIGSAVSDNFTVFMMGLGCFYGMSNDEGIDIGKKSTLRISYSQIDPTPTDKWGYIGNYYNLNGEYVEIPYNTDPNTNEPILPADIIVGTTPCYYINREGEEGMAIKDIHMYGHINGGKVRNATITEDESIVNKAYIDSKIEELKQLILSGGA